jgi:hypothetical protein
VLEIVATEGRNGTTCMHSVVIVENKGNPYPAMSSLPAPPYFVIYGVAQLNGRAFSWICIGRTCAPVARPSTVCT